jgi:peroxiredoxin
MFNHTDERVVMRLIFLVTIITGLAAAALSATFDAETASPEELVKAADRAQADGDAAALATVTAAMERRFPADGQVSEWLVKYYTDVRQDEKALAVVSRYCEAYPEAADWVFGRAQMEISLGKEAEALATLDKYIASFPKDAAAAYTSKGNIYVRSAEPDYVKAAEAYEAALAAIPAEQRKDAPYLLYNLGCCYACRGEESKALAALEEAVGYEPLLGAGLRGDRDLASLRGSAAFDAFVKEAEERAAAAEVERMTIKPGEAAPDFKLADLQKNEHTLAEFRGKLVVLNIWATWCPPCRAEIPDLVAFAGAHPDVAVVGISVDQPNADLVTFTSDYHFNYLVLRDDGAAAAEYLGEGGGIPQTYFIDAGGVVRAHIYGSTDLATFESHLAVLKENGK